MRSNPAGLLYPPGPKGLPFWGTLFEMHGDQEWLTYYNWSRMYGERYSFFIYLQPEVAGDGVTTIHDIDIAAHR
jgi:hypothetical protein